MKQRLIILMLLLGVFSLASAQENKKGKKEQKEQTEFQFKVVAFVIDHLTHEEIPNLKGELLMAADSSFVDSLSIRRSEKTTVVVHTLKQAGNYLLRFHADGYVEKYVSVDIRKPRKWQRYLQLPSIYLRKQPKKNEHELGEVVVKATKLKFYMDGDTLVYDADAFPMTEGSMLGDLMKRLPGVEVEKGGVIKVNGRKIDAMLLNGKDFFNSDRELLLENMPSYMVKSFNAYERAPEQVRGTARENTVPKEFVMDVRLKKEYSIGWIANAEAGGGATFFNNANGNKDGKYLGRLFGLRFTKNSRLTTFVNANNLNDYRNPGEEGDWGQLSLSEGLTSTVKGGMNYLYDQSDYTLPNTFRYQGSIDGTYADKNDANHTSSATFLDNGNTFGKSFFAKRSYDWELNTEHNLRYAQNKVKNLIQDLYIEFRPSLRYLKWDNSTASASATFAEDVASQLGKAWMDSITAPNAGELMKRYAINRTMSSTKGIGHWMDADGDVLIGFSPAYNDFMYLYLDITGKATDRSEDTYEHYTLDYPRDNTQGRDYRNRFSPAKEKTQSLRITPTMQFAFDHNRHHSMSVRYRYAYSHSDSNSPLYLLNRMAGWEQPDSHPLGMLPSEEEVLTTIDRQNSSHSDMTRYAQHPEITYNYTRYDNEMVKFCRFSVSAGMEFAHERQDYQKGMQIDTLMRRNTALPTMGIIYFNSNSKTDRYLEFYYRLSVTAPSMTTLLNVKDDSNPLHITLGNPDLKNTLTHNTSFSYSEKFGKTLFNASGRGNLQAHAVAYGFIYDKETGVRTSKPENVNGNWDVDVKSGVDFPLDKDDKWRMSENVSYNYNHSVDLAGTNETMEATRSVVGSHYITDNLSLKYRPNYKMEFGVNGSLTYQNSTSNRESFETLNVFTYHYGANAQIELPWGIQFSTDLTMYSRRGYSESSMNTNELVWNARVAKKLMKGNMTLMFDGFDLLGNLSNVRRYINAQGRTETFYNVIPSYGLFHVIYRLNKQPKKKE